MEADIVIVGAGPAGLRCGIELLHRRPSANVVILEKYKYLGGRAVTYHKKLVDMKGRCSNIQWENGAGRIHGSHTKVMQLLDRYEVAKFPLKTEIFYLENGILQPNLFEETLGAFLPELERLSPETLSQHTLREVITILLGPAKANDLLLQFPYRSEVNIMRADKAIQTFHSEMGTYDNYYGITKGFSKLIDKMVEDFKKRGGTIFNKHEVLDIQREHDKYLVKVKAESGNVLFKSKKVILALHAAAIHKLPGFEHWHILKHLKMEPLLRCYAVFPIEKSKKVWFSDIGRTVVPGPVRYFIPWDPSCGSVMISYTDANDARRLMSILDTRGEDALCDFIMSNIRKDFAFLGTDIPEPIFFKAHPWTDGCTYWIPGSYNIEKMSEESLCPFPEKMPNVFVCGESFSLRQAWMEGALEQADKLLAKYF